MAKITIKEVSRHILDWEKMNKNDRVNFYNIRQTFTH